MAATAARAGERVDQATGEIVAAPPAAASPSAFTVVEVQRAIAEEQAARLAARAIPREPMRCRELVMLDCQEPTLAEHAVYQYARGGTDISGASIRLLEAVARRWGNVDTGIREIARHNGFSDCEAFALDLESGFRDRRAFTVRHWRDTKRGGYAVTDERDIYEIVANAGQRRKRACLETVIPSGLVAAAVEECERTMKARADTSPEAMGKMLDAFAEFGVTRAQIEQRLQRRLEAIAPAQVVGLKRIYRSLRDGMSNASDWFEPDASSPTSDAGASPSPAPEAASASGSPPPRGRRRKPATEGTAAGAPDAAGPVSERTPGADNAATPSPSAPAGAPAFERRSLDAYRAEIERANDGDTASLVLDEARTAGLGSDELKDLAALWHARWAPEGDA
jgi:hypothetical protein